MSPMLIEVVIVPALLTFPMYFESLRVVFTLTHCVSVSIQLEIGILTMFAHMHQEQLDMRFIQGAHP